MDPRLSLLLILSVLTTVLAVPLKRIHRVNGPPSASVESFTDDQIFTFKSVTKLPRKIQPKETEHNDNNDSTSDEDDRPIAQQQLPGNPFYFDQGQRPTSFPGPGSSGGRNPYSPQYFGGQGGQFFGRDDGEFHGQNSFGFPSQSQPQFPFQSSTPFGSQIPQNSLATQPQFGGFEEFPRQFNGPTGPTGSTFPILSSNVEPSGRKATNQIGFIEVSFPGRGEVDARPEGKNVAKKSTKVKSRASPPDPTLQSQDNVLIQGQSGSQHEVAGSQYFGPQFGFPQQFGPFDDQFPVQTPQEVYPGAGGTVQLPGGQFDHGHQPSGPRTFVPQQGRGGIPFGQPFRPGQSYPQGGAHGSPQYGGRGQSFVPQTTYGGGPGVQSGFPVDYNPYSFYGGGSSFGPGGSHFGGQYSGQFPFYQGNPYSGHGDGLQQGRSLSSIRGPTNLKSTEALKAR